MNEVQRQQYRGNEAALAWRAEVGTAGGDDRAAAGIEHGGWRMGITAWFLREAAAAWAAAEHLEWVALGYCISSALIAVFGEHLAHPAKLIGGASAGCKRDSWSLCLVEARSQSAGGQGLRRSMKFWAFLAALGTHIFSFFSVSKNWESCASGDARLAGRQTDCVRSMADGCEPSLWLERLAHRR